MDLDRTQVNTPGCPAQGRCGFPNFSTTSLWIFRKETLSVMKGEWKTVRSKASFHVWIYLSQDSLQQPKAKHSVFSSALPSTKRQEQPCGLGHSQAINLVAKSLMYWCWWTSKPACCSLYHPLSFSQTLSFFFRLNQCLAQRKRTCLDTLVMFCEKARPYPSRGYAMIQGFVWTNLTHFWLTNTCKCTKKHTSSWSN